MAKGKGGAPAPVSKGSDRQNGKASKKRPKVWDASKRRLVTKIWQLIKNMWQFNNWLAD